MADFYSTNAYPRSNASSSNNPYDNQGSDSNGYYSTTNNSTTNNNTNNDFYSNPYDYGSQSSLSKQSTQPNQNQNQQSQPSLFSNMNTSQNGTNPMPSLWNPTMATQLASAALSTAAATTSSTNPNNKEAIYQMGLQMGHTFLDQGTARLIPGLETFMKTLRVYFAVDNGYVKRKMMRVLFSFFCKNWRRLPNNSNLTSPIHPQNPQMQAAMQAAMPPHPSPALIIDASNTTPHALPINDDNAPDLYIPFMSLITYVLLCALCYGTAGQFDPEVILNVTSKCVVIQCVEVCLFKFGLYMMNGSGNSIAGNKGESNLSFLDLFAFTGYKYLALTCNMLIGLSVTLMRFGSGSNSSDSSSSSSSNADAQAEVQAEVHAEVLSAMGQYGDDEGALSDIAAKTAASKIAAAALANAAASNNSEGYGGHTGYYIMFLWTASSVSYFMLKTMANSVPYSYQQQGSTNGPKREFVVLGFALSQFFTLWFLGQTKYLN